ncbi:hypothetical protein [Peribacillus kribbensis]|uniref:hypothetical protein n=1 Tax=Peribacillus kribbensis TaxID=356658 RepID=UPI0004028046|nr:hypothetical protein [Peribacillus kribbensis]
MNIPKEQVKKDLIHGWSVIRHKDIKVFIDETNTYILLDWEDDVVLKFTVADHSINILKASWDSKFNIDISSKVLLVMNEPEDEEE